MTASHFPEDQVLTSSCTLGKKKKKINKGFLEASSDSFLSSLKSEHQVFRGFPEKNKPNHR